MKKLLILFAALCLAAPAMAADWNFYGSARFATFYTNLDFDEAGVDDETNLQWAQQANSRIGANVKFNDEIGGRFEMSDSFGKRILFGTYNFGAGTLLIGQTFTPSSSLFYSNSVFDGDGGLLGIGQFYDGRHPMVQVSMGGLKLAAITQNTPGIKDLDGEPGFVFDPETGEIEVGTLGVAFANVESMLPKLEVSYGYRADQFFVDVFGGYQTYEVKGTTAGDVDVDAYVLGIGGGVNFGPAYLRAGFHIGQNYGNYGQWNRGIDNGAVIVDGKLVDNDNMGFLFVAGFKASDMLSFEGGFGYTEAELDMTGSSKQELQQVYLNSTINITRGFFIVPEIGMIQYKESGATSEPELFYLGAKWQINF